MSGLLCLRVGDKRNFQRYHRCILIVCWLSGLFAGYYFGIKTPDSVFALMRTSLSERVSIVWVFCALLLPLILSYTALRFSVPLLLLPLVFLKAYGFGYTLCCVIRAFGSAGWLMGTLCLFADVCSAILLLWFLLKYTKWENRRTLCDLTICISALITLGIFDYFVISPFTRSLLKY